MLKDLCVLIWNDIPSYSLCAIDIVRLNLNGLSSLQLVGLQMTNVANDLVGLDASMANLQYLDLKSSYKMRSCYGLGDLVALIELNLNECNNLENLPNLGKLKNL